MPPIPPPPPPGGPGGIFATWGISTYFPVDATPGNRYSISLSWLTNVLASVEESKYGFDFTFRFINQLVSTSQIDTSDLKFAASEEELRESVELRELPFTRTRDIINIYEIEKAIIMVALQVDK